jgi:hypothetical protein
MKGKRPEVVQSAHDFFRRSESFESDNRVERLEAMRFVRLGEQWPDAIKAQRSLPGKERPMLTINRLSQFRNQVINEIRQNTPSIKVRPVDDKADVETAESIQGIIRHIQSVSKADIAYDTASEWQVDCGLGYIVLRTDYCDEESFDQDIFIETCCDPFKVYFDPASVEIDGSDAQEALIVEEMTEDAFKRKYPGAGVTSWLLAGPGESGWWNQATKMVRVGLYYWIESTPSEIVRSEDGQAIPIEEIPPELRDQVPKQYRRKVTKKVCRWAKIGGDSVLEEGEFPVPMIPIVPVYGNVTIAEGKRYISGLIRGGMDAQRNYNFWLSAETELLALAPRAPFIGAAGSFDGYTDKWATANQVNHAFLEYNPVSIAGTLAPRPERQPFAGPPQGVIEAKLQSIEDMKASMGIYDPGIAKNNDAQSGKAINALMNQASTGTFHYKDNLGKSIQQAGRIILALIPKIYDVPRIARILGEDGAPQTVMLDPNMQQAKGEQIGPDGKLQTVINPSIGKYDLVVDVGPNYATRRVESAEAMREMAQAYPPIMQFAGDLLVKAQDRPDAEKIAERLRASIPPEIIGDNDENGEEDPRAVQMMDQMSQQMEQMSAALHEAMDQLEEKEQETAIKWFEAWTKRKQVEMAAQMNTAKIDAMAMDATFKAMGDVRADEAHGLSMAQGQQQMQMATQEPDGDEA